MRYLAFLTCLGLLIGCKKAPPAPQTEEQWLAFEKSARDADLQSLSARAYRAARSAIPDSRLQVADGVSLSGNEIGGVLAVAFIVSGRHRLAHYELSQISPQALGPRQREVLIALRGINYSSLKWKRLARAELAQLTVAGQDTGAEVERRRRAGHYLLVYFHVMDDDYRAAAREVRENRDVFEAEPVGLLCIAAAEAEAGNYAPAADALDRFAASSQTQLRPEDRVYLRQLSAELRAARDPKSLLLRAILRLGADLVAGDAIKARCAGALDKARQVAAELAAKIK